MACSRNVWLVVECVVVQTLNQRYRFHIGGGGGCPSRVTAAAFDRPRAADTMDDKENEPPENLVVVRVVVAMVVVRSPCHHAFMVAAAPAGI
jgi:hypothetical protein